MTEPNLWQESFSTEIGQAEAARAAGNEGKARVCARRAAGIVIRVYLAGRGVRAKTPSAYDMLRHLEALEDVPEEIREKAGDFLVKVDENYHLPVEADLIAEARWLAARLMGG